MWLTAKSRIPTEATNVQIIYPDLLPTHTHRHTHTQMHLLQGNEGQVSMRWKHSRHSSTVALLAATGGVIDDSRWQHRCDRWAGGTCCYCEAWIPSLHHAHRYRAHALEARENNYMHTCTASTEKLIFYRCFPCTHIALTPLEQWINRAHAWHKLDDATHVAVSPLCVF